MWSSAKFLNAFRGATEKLVNTVSRKNADYAGTDDPFANFMLVETVTKGRISAEDGIIVRMTDKLARLANLTTAEAQVEDESFLDTAYDAAAYAVILALIRRSRTEPDEFETTELVPDAAANAEVLAKTQQGYVEQLRLFLAGLKRDQRTVPDGVAS